ncbi:uncharacterized protein LOC127378127 [Dicentrarchus labrax]|uniref:uncharacterized protein LOC127378127 n=1 Tax=Dicentrarchus labrax TaxID=13489 RepID=UPI0021F5BB43|nr:uncharacterized protein LOC127378127 [Dicentrarchus labrax]
MSDAIEEAEDRAARREAQALAREQRRAENNGPTATSSTLPGGSRPSHRTASHGAASASCSGLSIAGPSTRSAPSSASHGHQLPAPSGTSPPSLPAPGWLLDEPSTSAFGLRGSRLSSSPSQSCRQTAAPLSSSSQPSAGPTASTGHTNMEDLCGQCREPDPPGVCSEGLVPWVQCNKCAKWFHTICVGWEELDKDEFWCFWCLDMFDKFVI